MKKTIIYGAIGGVLLYLYLRSKKSKPEKFEIPPANPKGKPVTVSNPKFNFDVPVNPKRNPDTVSKPAKNDYAKPLLQIGKGEIKPIDRTPIPEYSIPTGETRNPDTVVNLPSKNRR